MFYYVISFARKWVQHKLKMSYPAWYILLNRLFMHAIYW